MTNIIASELIKENSISIISHIHQDATVVDSIKIYKMPNDKIWLAKENFVYAEKVVANNYFDAIVY